MAIKIFISYAPADVKHLKTLEVHLAALRREGLIETWHAGRLVGGDVVQAVTNRHFDEAALILLLVSASFIASDDAYEEMTRAVERSRAGTRVMPILVRACDWRCTPIEVLRILPQNATPVEHRSWTTPDQPWTSVSMEIRGIVEEMLGEETLGRRLSYAPPGASRPDQRAVPRPARVRPIDPLSARAVTAAVLVSSMPYSAGHGAWKSSLSGVLRGGALVVGGMALAALAVGVFGTRTASTIEDPLPVPGSARTPAVPMPVSAGPSPQPLPAATRKVEIDYNGSDARQPALAPDDQGFVDKRGGWDWGNRCWKHIISRKWGWAKAECDQAMAMNPVSPEPRAQVLYNLGLIEQSIGNMVTTRQYFEQSLALRENPDVRHALDSLP